MGNPRLRFRTEMVREYDSNGNMVLLVATWVGGHLGYVGVVDPRAAGRP